MRTSLSALFLSLVLAPGFAAAQKQPEEAKPDSTDAALDEAMADDPAGQPEAPPEEEAAPFDPNEGMDENPNDPSSVFAEQNQPKETAKEQAAKARTGYPQELIYRPINLPEGMSETGFAVPAVFSAKSVGANLSGSYAVTKEVQIGLRYGLGTLVDSDFSVGKAVAVGGQYLFTNWIAASLTVPIYLDPFAMGVNLGAPIWFTFFDKVSLRIGEDLLSFRLYRFLPSIDDAAQNDALVASDMINEIVPLWKLRISGRFIYQLTTEMAIDGRFGFVMDDVSDDTPVHLDAGLTYASSSKLDFGARLGFGRLDDGDSFGASVFTALRL